MAVPSDTKIKVRFFWMALHLPANHAGRLIINISVGSCCAGADPLCQAINTRCAALPGHCLKEIGKLPKVIPVFPCLGWIILC